MQRKILFIAALLFAAVCAKAQSIRVLNSCYAESKVFTFFQADAYSTPIKYHTIGSWCPKNEMPTYRLATGNYEFRNLPIEAGEVWNWFIETAGKTTQKGTIQKNSLLVVPLGPTQRLTIIVAPVQDPNATVSASGF